jgi:hypothetical protein
VAAEVDGELELGPDAVIGGDQQRVAVAGCLEIEEAAEAAKLGACARAGGGFGKRADRLDQRVAGVDLNACVGISKRLLGHRRRA